MYLAILWLIVEGIMRVLSAVICAIGISALSASAIAQTYPMPSTSSGSGGAGTATNQPYTPVKPRSMPSTAPNKPALVSPKAGGAQSGATPLRAPVESLAPPDQGLQLLEQQRQRNSESLTSPKP